MAFYFGDEALAELWAMIEAENAKGAKVEAGSYVGTGGYGSDSPNSLTFDMSPKVVIVYTPQRNSAYSEHSYYQTYVLFLVNGTSVLSYYVNNSSGTGQTTTTLKYNISGNSLTWYLEQVKYNSSKYQLNTSGTTYYYVAIG